MKTWWFRIVLLLPVISGCGVSKERLHEAFALIQEAEDECTSIAADLEATFTMGGHGDRTAEAVTELLEGERVESAAAAMAASDLARPLLAKLRSRSDDASRAVAALGDHTSELCELAFGAAGYDDVEFTDALRPLVNRGDLLKLRVLDTLAYDHQLAARMKLEHEPAIAAARSEARKRRDLAETRVGAIERQRREDDKRQALEDRTRLEALGREHLRQRAAEDARLAEIRAEERERAREERTRRQREELARRREAADQYRLGFREQTNARAVALDDWATATSRQWMLFREAVRGIRVATTREPAVRAQLCEGIDLAWVGPGAAYPPDATARLMVEDALGGLVDARDQCIAGGAGATSRITTSLDIAEDAVGRLNILMGDLGLPHRQF